MEPDALPSREPDPTRGASPRPARVGHRAGYLVVRGLMTALAVTIAVVLLSRGDLLLGGLIAVLAALRVVHLVSIGRRRRRWRAAIERRRPSC
jgi:hypothetical protein